MTKEVQLTEEARNDLAPHGVLRAGINEGNQVQAITSGPGRRADRPVRRG